MKYKLEGIVFICGAIVMILELAGARLVAPALGTSIIVWSSIIGIILGSLSLGYYWGGHLADRQANYKMFSFLIFMAALAVTLILPVNELFIPGVASAPWDLRLRALVITTLLFSPSTILLGTISPYAVRLKLSDLTTSGTTVGSLYAISTLGSITGTLLAGFVLIQYFGTSMIVLVLALALLLVSLAAYPRGHWWVRLAAALLIVGMMFLRQELHKQSMARGVVDVDTDYSRVLIVDRPWVDGRPTREMIIGNEHSSGIYLDSTELLYDYTRLYRLAAHFNPNFQHTLLIGGAAYSYPKDYLREFPQATMDVVEIDPGVTRLAEEYFSLKPDSRLSIYHEDARTFFLHDHPKYDVIYGDAFRSYSTPYQLTTVEFTRQMYNSLNKDGVVLVNIISAIEGDSGKFLRAQLATYKAVFPQVHLLAVRSEKATEVQNLMLVALKSEVTPSWVSDNQELNSYLSKRWVQPITQDLPIFTDEQAPVERYLMKTLLEVS